MGEASLLILVAAFFFLISLFALALLTIGGLLSGPSGLGEWVQSPGLIVDPALTILVFLTAAAGAAFVYVVGFRTPLKQTGSSHTSREPR